MINFLYQIHLKHKYTNFFDKYPWLNSDQRHLLKNFNLYHNEKIGWNSTTYPN